MKRLSVLEARSWRRPPALNCWQFEQEKMFKSDSKVPIFHEKFLLESEFWKAEISVLATVHVTLQPEYMQYSRVYYSLSA